MNFYLYVIFAAFVTLVIIVLASVYNEISFEMSKPFKFKFRADRHKDGEKPGGEPDSTKEIR